MAEKHALSRLHLTAVIFIQVRHTESTTNYTKKEAKAVGKRLLKPVLFGPAAKPRDDIHRSTQTRHKNQPEHTVY